MSPIVGAPGSPAIGADGTIYDAFEGFHLRGSFFGAFNPDGSVKWSFSGTPFAFAFGNSPTVGADGTIYGAGIVQSGNFPFFQNLAYLYAVNPDGTQKWSVGGLPDFAFDTAVGADGTLYVSTPAGLCAIH